MRVDPVYIDDLTGVLNRRYLYDHLHNEIEAAEREGRSLWMAIIDIDDFKAINDTYGHLEGDNILREVASIFRRSIRVSDKVIRFGGDEFIILLIDGGLISALTVLKRIRENISRQRFSTGISGLTIEVTISIGLAGYPDDTNDPDKLLSLADEALYVSKNRGKSCIALVSDIPTTTLLSRDILELLPVKTLVGREKEVNIIQEFLLSRTENVLIISGPFGIGKSRLLSHAETICSMYGFLPFYTGTYGKKLPAICELWQHFEANYLDVYPDLLEFLPSNLLDELKNMRNLQEGQERKVIQLLIEEILNKIVTNYKVAFLIDDLLYADEDSFWAIARFISKHPKSAKLLVSVDSDFKDHNVDTLLNVFSERFVTKRLSLDSLSMDAIDAYLKAVFKQPVYTFSVVETLYQASCGNPMYLEELLKYLMVSKLIFKVQQRWIFKSADEIKQLIGDLDFEQLVKHRIVLLDDDLKQKMYELKAGKGDISCIWKADIGVVRKGYLLDLVKALQKAKLLKDRDFFVEDFPKQAVYEIFSIISKESMTSIISEEQPITDLKEISLLLENLKQLINFEFSALYETEFKAVVVRFLELFASLLEKDEIKQIKQISQKVISELNNLIPQLWVHTSVLYIHRKSDGLVVNGIEFKGRSFIPVVAKLLDTLGTDSLFLTDGLRVGDILGMAYHYYLLRYDTVTHNFTSPYISMNKKSLFNLSALANLHTILNKKELHSLNESLMEASVCLYRILVLNWRSIEDKSLVIDVYSRLFLSMPSLFRLWLSEIFSNAAQRGIPDAVKRVLFDLPSNYIAGQLLLLYQHKKIPFAFIKELVWSFAEPQKRDELVQLLLEEISNPYLVETLEGNKPYEKELFLNEVLSLSDLDKWGEIIFLSAQELADLFKEDSSHTNLIIDGLGMSLGDEDLLVLVVPYISKLISAFKEIGRVDLIAKMWNYFLGSIFSLEKDLSVEIYFTLKEFLLTILSLENNSEPLLNLISKLQSLPESVRHKLFSEVEVEISTLRMVDLFFEKIRRGQKDYLHIVKVIFFIGGFPVKELIKRVIVSEDVSSFGYFDAFWARRVVGTNVPEKLREKVIFIASSYLTGELWFIVRNAMELLSYVIKPSEVGIFSPLLDNPNPRIQKRLVFILSRIASREAYKMLIELLKRVKDIDLKDRIYRILKKVDDPEISGQLELIFV